jgi:hypothetical protein
MGACYHMIRMENSRYCNTSLTSLPLLSSTISITFQNRNGGVLPHDKDGEIAVLQHHNRYSVTPLLHSLTLYLLIYYNGCVLPHDKDGELAVL